MIKAIGDRTIKDLSIYELLKLNENEKENITTHGIIHSVRDMGDFAFIILRKANGLIQCVYNKKGSDREKFLLKDENAVRIKGSVKNEPRAVNGIEITIKDIELLSSPKKVLPFNISKRKLNIAIENEMPIRPIVLRNEQRRSVFKIQETIIKGFRNYLESNNFTEIFTPKIVAAGAEGGANIFKFEYFGKKAFLAQSPQFYKQMLIPVYERVFEIGPVFRAEKHNTVRHLNEYISADFEMGFINDFYDIINMETGMIKHTLKYIKENYGIYLKNLDTEITEIDSIPCIKFKEAKEMISEKYSRKIRDPYDLEPEEEKLIGKLFKEEYNSDFVFVTHYPSKKRPFYAMDDPENEKYTLSFDLLFKGMEITTGGQRIHDYDMQIKKMVSKGLNPDEFESYLMLHKHGCPPHGGLGIGIERFLMKLIGENNIRSASMFPRDTLRLNP